MRFKKLLKLFFLVAAVLAFVGTGVYRRIQGVGDMRSEPLNTKALRRVIKSTPLQRPATIERVSMPLMDPPVDGRGFDLDRFVDRQKNSVSFTRDQLERYVETNHHDAASLITAYQASLNPEYLRRAAREYPDNAGVQLAVLTHKVFPEARRKWIDLLLQSSPKNAFAYYLSALDRFENVNVDAAISDLMEATRRPRCRHVEYDFLLNLLDLLQCAGDGSTQARLDVIADIPLGHLFEFKRLSDELTGLMVQYRKMGDTNSFHAAGHIGLKLIDRLNEGMDGVWIAAQRVRIDMEQRLLRLYSPAETVPFFRETAQERLAELETQGDALNEVEQRLKNRLVTASEEERADFVTRVTNQGQLGAIRWLRP